MIETCKTKFLSKFFAKQNQKSKLKKNIDIIPFEILPPSRARIATGAILIIILITLIYLSKI